MKQRQQPEWKEPPPRPMNVWGLINRPESLSPDGTELHTYLKLIQALLLYLLFTTGNENWWRTKHAWEPNSYVICMIVWERHFLFLDRQPPLFFLEKESTGGGGGRKSTREYREGWTSLLQYKVGKISKKGWTIKRSIKIALRPPPSLSHFFFPFLYPVILT